ncbi:MAG: hypothetical protein SGCHY_003737 [Lobulomycetales sp.]
MLCDDESKESTNLLFAIPKKGRVYDECMAILKAADVRFIRKQRLDIAYCTNMPITLVFLPQKDLVQFVGKGNVDVGIAGQDMIAEGGLQDKVSEILALNFGKCRLQVQVPVNGSIKTNDDLAGKRIATSFPRIAEQFFDKIFKDSGKPNPEMQYISGSVEAACSLGLADAIVDLVDSGETMRASGLMAISTIMETQMSFICNSARQAMRPFDSPKRKLVDTLARRFSGTVTANKYVLVSYNIAKKDYPQAKWITPGKKEPTVTNLGENGTWIAVNAMVLKAEAVSVMDRLEQAGAEDILVFNIQNCR